MKSNNIISMILILVLSLGLVACGSTEETTGLDQTSKDQNSVARESQESEEKILRVAARYGMLETLDVYLASYNIVFETADVIYDNLIGKDPNTLELFPVLLEDMPEISEDGKTFTFKLKKGIKFHDGTELTAKDVEFSFNRFFNPEIKGVNTWMADMIEGSKEVMDGTADTLSGFKLIDDYSFTISLYYPFVPFTAALAASPLKIYPEKACTEAGDRWGIDVAIGTGAFKVDSFEPRRKLVVSRFDNYHGGPKKLDKIEFIDMDLGTQLLEFEAGNVDVIRSVDTELVETYLEDPEFKDNVKFQEVVFATYYLNFNQAMKPLDDIRVREAISLAVNIDELCNIHFKGYVKPAVSLIPIGIVGHNETLPQFEHDPERAKELLVEAGYHDGIDLTVVETEGDPFIDIYLVLQQQLKEANINLNIELVDSATFFDMRSNGKMQLYLRSWSCDYIDPDFFLYSLYHGSVSTLFSTGFSDPEYDQKLEAGRLIKDLDEKQKYYEELEYDLSREKKANRPLYYGSGFYLISDRTEDVLMKKEGLFHYVDGDIK